ncbi:hypothetical protein EV363DRAFT_754988 [Boletus edulis]|nr:hypothetical protein EV363DRAFT_754988 [Boletus edulis]
MVLRTKIWRSPTFPSFILIFLITDGQPPLAIILDTTTFIGGASIPLGLMTLGSALARMEIPAGRFRSLPLGAIGALGIARLVIMPVLGVLITHPNDRIDGIHIAATTICVVLGSVVCCVSQVCRLWTAAATCRSFARLLTW